MTPAQRAAIYGESPNAPQHTSNLSEAQAEAKQKRLAVAKQQQDALNSDTVALDFSHEGTATLPVAVQAARAEGVEKASAEEIGGKQTQKDGAAQGRAHIGLPIRSVSGSALSRLRGNGLRRCRYQSR